MHKSWLSQLIFFIFSVICLLTLGEIALRLKLSLTRTPLNHDRQTFLQIKSTYVPYEVQYAPYLLWRAKPNLHGGIGETNSLGYRGKDWSVTKPPGTFRVIMTGGSAAWGVGAFSDDTTIEGFLQRDLQQYLGPDSSIQRVEVLNLAEKAYTSTQEFIQWKEIVKFSPDLVIHYTGFNDAYVGLLGEPAGWNLPFYQNTLLTTPGWWGIARLTEEKLDEIFSASLLYLVARQSVSQFQARVAPTVYTDSRAVTDVFGRNLELIASLAEAEHIPALFVIQPVIFLGEKTTTSTEESIVAEEERLYPHSKEYFRSVFDRFGESVQRVQQKFPHLQVLNTAGIFDSTRETIYFDLVHTNSKGNELLAAAMARVIAPLIQRAGQAVK